MNWQEISTMDLVMYSTPWCGDCRRLKGVFSRNNIPYQEVDIDADAQAAEELKKATGRGAIPFVRLPNGVFIRGWHNESPAGFDETIFFKEVKAALG